MSNYSEQEILNKRNIEALKEGMKHFESKRQEDRQRVEQLLGTITQLSTQIQELTIQVAILRAKTQGRGATTQ